MTELAPGAGRHGRHSAGDDASPTSAGGQAPGYPPSGGSPGANPYAAYGGGPAATGYYPSSQNPPPTRNVPAAEPVGYRASITEQGRAGGGDTARRVEPNHTRGYEAYGERQYGNTPGGNRASGHQTSGRQASGYQTSGYQAAGYAAGYASGGNAASGYAPGGNVASGYAPGGYVPGNQDVAGLGFAQPGPGGRGRSGWSTTEPLGGGGPARGRHATGWDSGFDRVVGWTLLGSLLPGSGLVAAGRRAFGWSVLGVCLLAAAASGALVVLGDPLKLVLTQFVAHPERLTIAAAMIVVIGVLWSAHVVTTNLSLRRFAQLTGFQSALSWVLVSVLAVGGVSTAVVAGRDVRLSQDAITSMLGGDNSALSSKARRPKAAAADPWRNVPRMNVLLIGSDAGADRTGIRTDTIIVASIDTKTGETVLFSLPRNLEHVPFPPNTQQAVDYPDGFYCPNHECMLNALWQFGVEHKDTYYKGEKNPGLVATREGVEQALGLDIDTYAMVDLRGFMQFVDAIGGVTINVTRAIPVGGHRDAATGRQIGVTSYIKPGKQKLDGYHTLWYARSRSDSDDFERMRRQRCVIGALAAQANPQNIALSLPGIMKAAKDNIRTGIQISDVDAWVTLALRVQKAHVRSLPFTNAVIASGDPDFDKMHELVRKAQTEPVASPSTPTPTTSATPATPSPTSTKKHTTPTPTVTENPESAVDVKAVC